MYYLNKIVWFFLNPLTVALLGAVAGAILLGVAKSHRRRRVGWVVLGLSIAMLWFESTLSCVCLLGLPLERPYLATQDVDSLPKADAIVVLGGGIGKCESMVYPEMYDGADRVWHGARLWKAGKAPKVVLSGSNDRAAAVPLLLDFGVPAEAIVVDDESRNTYENSRFTERLLRGAGNAPTNSSVLLVTSAWHMPRACGNFARTSLSAVPAACDFVASNLLRQRRRFWDWLAPDAEMLRVSNYLFKEWLGRLARK